MHFPHAPAHACVWCLWTWSRSLPRLSFVFSCWGSECLLRFLSCSWACVSVSVSAFESPALFSEQRLPGFALPVGPSLPPSLPPLPPSFGGKGSGGARVVTGAPLSAPEPPPPASPWNVPPTTTLEPHVCVWGGGGSASPSGQPPEEIVPSSSSFLCGRGRVASCGSEAEEALGRARAFGRPARWRPRWPATATRPRDGRAVCQEPPGGRFYIVPPLWSFGETFRRIMTQPPGPRQSCQGPATLAVTVPGTPRPRDVLLSPEIGSLGFWGG